MLDKTYVCAGGPSHISQNTRIEEFRAPTDESMRLIGEMEEKVKKKIVASGKVENNLITFVYAVFKPNFSMDDYELMAGLVINGEQFTITEKITRYSVSSKSLDEIINTIYTNVAKELTSQIMDMAFNNKEFISFVKGVQ